MSDAARLFAFRRNAVITASAGTGKTFTLTGVTVHLLLGATELGEGSLRAPLDPARLVATTFSRKAAAEIRARVASELERLSDPTSAVGSPYFATLEEVVTGAGLEPWRAEHVALRARRALERLGRAEIGTLHGLARSVVARYALEAGFRRAPEIASEDEDIDARERAVEAALGAAFAADPSAARRLADTAGGTDALVSALSDTLASLVEEGAPPDALVIDDRDARRIGESLEALSSAALALDSDRFAEDVARFGAARRIGDAEGALAALASLIERDRPRKRSDAEEAFFALRDALPGASHAERARRFVGVVRSREHFTPTALAARALLADAAARHREAEVAAGRLGFSSLLREARDLLRARPEVARELSSEIDALLVDECQDTSRLQRDLVLLLWARPSTRREGVVPSPGGLRESGLLLVGDRKQSIYGFRGADVGVFGELCVGLAGAAARSALRIPAALTWEPERPSADFFALRHNRRGAWELLQVANAFSAARFSPAAPRAELYEIEYSSDTEDLLAPEPPPEAPRARTAWLRLAKKRASRLDEARVLAARVADEIAAGAPLGPRGARPRFADVGVLAHTNEMLDAVAYALAERGIPYVVAGRGFFSAREVLDLLAFVALAQDPGDRLALLTVLRGPWCAVDDRTLLALTEPGRGLVRPGPRWDDPPVPELLQPSDAPRLARLRATLERLAPIGHRLGPGAVLREAMRELDLEAVLASLPRGAQRVANARKLVAIADRYADPRELLEAARRASSRGREAEAATFSEEDDAVRLLTVHASKGLDFPIVMLPEAGRVRTSVARPPLIVSRDEHGALVLAVRLHDGLPLQPPSYTDAVQRRSRRDRAERQRLWYVAVTRARDRMCFVGGDEDAAEEAAASTLARLVADRHPWLEATDVDVPPQPERAPEAVGVAPCVVAPSAVASPLRGRAALAIAPTALGDFAHCPRRFELVHLLAFPEHPRRLVADDDRAAERAEVPLDAKREGTIAHRVLERVPAIAIGTPGVEADVRALLATEGITAEMPGYESQVSRLLRFLTGAYARRIAAEGAEVDRERAIALDLRGDDGLEVLLRGSIDLLVRWPDGSCDVVDYKRARGPSPEPYAFQLDVYALAVRVATGASVVRTGVSFLGGRSPEPAWRTPRPEAEMRADVLSIAARLRAARSSAAFPRAPIATCEAIGCGYVGRCHPGSTRAKPPRPTTT